MPTLVIVLLIVALVIVFSVQNAAPIAVTFLFWQTEASGAIVLFLAVICGVVIGVGLTSYFVIKRSHKAKKPREEQTPARGGPAAGQ